MSLNDGITIVCSKSHVVGTSKKANTLWKMIANISMQSKRTYSTIANENSRYMSEN